MKKELCMLEIIDVLERLGGDSSAAVLDVAGYEEMVRGLDVPESHLGALLARDAKALSNELGGREVMNCMILVPDEEG
jgi:hypothetical protein